MKKYLTKVWVPVLFFVLLVGVFSSKAQAASCNLDTVKNNVATLKTYIQSNGKTSETSYSITNGICTINMFTSPEFVNFVTTITTSSSVGTTTTRVSFYNKDRDYDALDRTFVNIQSTTNSVFYSASTVFDSSSYTKNTTLPFTLDFPNNSNVTESIIQNTCNTSMRLAIALLDTYLKDNTSLEIGQFGFLQWCSSHIYTTQITKNASCTETGERLKECSKCGLQISEVIPKSHTFGNWTITKRSTALANGVQVRVCSKCKATDKKSLAKLKATIKLSATNKTIKKKKNYTLKISNLAYGDSVKSVVTSKKAVAVVKKVKSNQYKITGKKKGKVNITVTLKSGKKAILKVTVK